MATARISSDLPWSAKPFALEAAWRGWRVFPVVGDSKVPLVKQWPQIATTEVSAIQAWSWHENLNYGIVTGPGSSLVVIDVDTYTGGRVEDLGALPPTPSVRTARGGLHLYFRHPEGIHVPSSKHTLGPSIEVKAAAAQKAAGYFVVGVGSRFKGNRYGWIAGAHPDDVPPPPLPDALLQRILTARLPRHTEDVTTNPLPVFAASASGMVGDYWLNQAIRMAKPGVRNDVGYWLACQLRDHHVPIREAERYMMRYARNVISRFGADYSVEEAMRTLKSAYSTSPRPPCLVLLPPPPPPIGVVMDTHSPSVRIHNNSDLPRVPVSTPLTWDYPAYLEDACAADALPNTGDLHSSKSPAHLRRARQQHVFVRVWESLWPNTVFGGPRLRSLFFHTAAAGYAGHECEYLVWFMVQVFVHPSRDPEIEHPVAYILKCLKTSGIVTPYRERPRSLSQPRQAPGASRLPLPPPLAVGDDYSSSRRAPPLSSPPGPRRPAPAASSTPTPPPAFL